jgi:hypothetical protein
MDRIKVSQLEVYGCGIHHCCKGCMMEHLVSEVKDHKVPACFQPGCKADVDPLVAHRLMSKDIFDRYLQLALWRDPRVETCPACKKPIFAESDTVSGMAKCPECYFEFCTDCRCPAHLPWTDKKEALAITQGGGSPPPPAPKGYLEEAAWARGCLEARRVQRRALERLQRHVQRGGRPDEAFGGSWTFTEVYFEGPPGRERQTTRQQDIILPELLAQDMKNCPRCAMPTLKMTERNSDEAEMCDHMTCPRCSKEWCWQCGADRKVIFAHGNHFHWDDCKFEGSDYKGPDDHLPNKCYRCKMNGRVCARLGYPRKRAPAENSMVDQYTSIMDACVRWVTEVINAGSCSLPNGHARSP